MSTPVANPHPKTVSLPSGITVIVNTDGTATIEDVRKLWQYLAAATG